LSGYGVKNNGKNTARRKPSNRKLYAQTLPLLHRYGASGTKQLAMQEASRAATIRSEELGIEEDIGAFTLGLPARNNHEGTFSAGK